VGSADGLIGDTSKAPAYACRNRSTRKSGPGDDGSTRALELGGTTVSGQTVTGEVTGRFTSVAAGSSATAGGSADLPAGAGIATVIRAGEATGGVCLSSSTSVIGAPECATPDWSMRMGSAVGMSAELGGGVFGRACRASAVAFCFLARSAFNMAASEALFREGAAVEVLEAAGGTVGGAAGTTPGATGSRDRAALQHEEQISTRDRARRKISPEARNYPAARGRWAAKLAMEKVG